MGTVFSMRRINGRITEKCLKDMGYCLIHKYVKNFLMEASHAPPLPPLYQAIISAGEVISTGLGSF